MDGVSPWKWSWTPWYPPKNKKVPNRGEKTAGEKPHLKTSQRAISGFPWVIYCSIFFPSLYRLGFQPTISEIVLLCFELILFFCLETRAAVVIVGEPRCIMADCV